MLSLFSSTFWPSVCLLLINVFLDFLPLFYMYYLFFFDIELCLSVTKSCLTLHDPMDCSLPGSSVHGISQAGILEWVSISFSKGFFWPRDWSQVSCIAGKFFTTEPAGKPSVHRRAYFFLPQDFAHMFFSLPTMFLLSHSPWLASSYLLNLLIILLISS